MFTVAYRGTQEEPTGAILKLKTTNTYYMFQLAAIDGTEATAKTIILKVNGEPATNIQYGPSTRGDD